MSQIPRGAHAHASAFRSTLMEESAKCVHLQWPHHCLLDQEETPFLTCKSFGTCHFQALTLLASYFLFGRRDHIPSIPVINQTPSTFWKMGWRRYNKDTLLSTTHNMLLRGILSRSQLEYVVLLEQHEFLFYPFSHNTL